MSLRDDLSTYIRSVLLRDGSAAIGPNDSLIEAGILDSVSLMNLIAHIEAVTGVRIPDAQVTPDNFDTTTAIEGLVSRLRPSS